MDHRPGRRRLRRAAVSVVVALGLAACSSAAGPAGSPGTSPSPGASPSPGLTAGASTAPATSPISQADAIAKVLAQQPRFAGIGPLDPNMIGQSAWYEVSPGVVGWRVMVTIGSGDCQAGCINRHSWTYDVDPTGSVQLVLESGDPLDDGAGGAGPGGEAGPPVAIPGDGGPWIAGRATAGPVCPVERIPPDPACADRPVGGATVIIRDASGADVGRATTAADGTFLVAVPAGGTYRVEAQPVQGILGTPATLEVSVQGGSGDWVEADLSFDTGIR